MPKLAAALAVALVAPLLVAGTQTAGFTAAPDALAARCDAFTKATYAGNVPGPVEVLGFPLGKREVSLAETRRYLRAVDRASDRVSLGIMARSQLGRPLRYAMVGAPRDIRRAKRATTLLRDPSTPRKEAAQIAADAPAIAWVAGNVHGDEESGADSALRVLRDLADRTDCAANRIQDNTVVVIVPIQNPDGRARDWRRNANAFDLNRDWFARTQPETDGKLALLRRYPAVLFIDAHEMGSRGYFFPPNSDPIYHEVADRSVRWINNLYGAAMKREFDERGIRYFNRGGYDFFGMNFGDTVPATGFLGAGMTFEKNNDDPLERRVREQYLATWTSLSSLARHKDAVLRGWAASYRQAFRQGQQGRLEPNRAWSPGKEVILQVPKERVRHYFVLSKPGKQAVARALVRRLQRMDVEVRTLTAPLRVPGYTAYGREPRTRRLPAGTYWIPMAQAQKHWVQAMMNEDTYAPFPYFYDVTAWSAPLLFNAPAGRSGARLQPRWTPTPRVAEPRAPQRPRGVQVGLWQLGGGVVSWEATGWMRWLLDDKWRVPYTRISTPNITRRNLADFDVLIVPNGIAKVAYDKLGADGRQSLRTWLRRGGRLVTMGGSAELISRLGITSAQLRPAESDIPGSLVRAKVSRGPLGAGVGRTVWVFDDYDRVMTVPDAADVAVRFPAFGSEAFFISGFARGERELSGTAAVADQRYGRGRVVLFAGEPNFRGFTDGTQRLLWNAAFGPEPAGLRAASPRQRQAAARASRGLVQLDGRLVVTVRRAASAETVAALGRAGLRPVVQRLGGGLVRYVVATASGDDSPVLGRLVSDLRTLGSSVVAVRVP